MHDVATMYIPIHMTNNGAISLPLSDVSSAALLQEITYVWASGFNL